MSQKSLARPKLSLSAIMMALAILAIAGCQSAVSNDHQQKSDFKEAYKVSENDRKIVLGGGCFWCIEAVFQLFKGVDKVVSGYAGGAGENPSYEQVSGGGTGHAEVVEISFDPEVISLSQILTIFFHAHDPTTMNSQGHDFGTQYRSIILYSNEEQKAVAEAIMTAIASKKVWGDKKLVTQLEKLEKFYSAEDYHQDYYINNTAKPYCSLVIGPKLQKVKEEFKSLLK